MNAVLVIAGVDSSGGAGLARDVRTLTGLRTEAVCAVTAVTAQSDRSFMGSLTVPAALVAQQIAAARATRPIGAVKIGMLGCEEVVRAVVAALAGLGPVPIVVDPVLRSSSGGTLLDEPGQRALLEELLPRCALVTPNVPEAALLTGESAADDEAVLLRQGQKLLARGARAVLLKGGHASGSESIDVLLQPDAAPLRLRARRQAHTPRGTGCALASAIAALLARGDDLARACAGAKDHLTAQMLRSN
ncbi:MAG: hydroxymethylpyrimidine/phosphomethylpyrimidine kinase [Proteobacteria bacterium]|nr:hydroxymethylpyrimidine/phosphomethylpyrimidine kinase [Pseudomonadota bacterium]